MENKELKQPIPEELKDEMLDAVTGGFTNEDHTFTMEPGVIKNEPNTIEPGKIIPGAVTIELGINIEPYVTEPNFTTRPSDPLTR